MCIRDRGRTRGGTDQCCKREESPCQLGAVHTWHWADNSAASAFVRYWTKADKRWFSYSLHCLHGRACHLVGPRRNKARIFPKSHNCFILWALLFVYQHSGG